MVGRLLFPVQLVMVASPAYLARHGVPRTVEDLQQHRCSVFRHPSTGRTLPWFLPSGGEPETREMEMVPALATNDSELELQAVLAGQVIAQVASFAAAPLMRSGRMVPVLLDQVCAPIDLHVYYGSRTALPGGCAPSSIWPSSSSRTTRLMCWTRRNWLHWRCAAPDGSPWLQRLELKFVNDKFHYH